MLSAHFQFDNIEIKKHHRSLDVTSRELTQQNICVNFFNSDWKTPREYRCMDKWSMSKINFLQPTKKQKKLIGWKRTHHQYSTTPAGWNRYTEFTICCSHGHLSIFYDQDQHINEPIFDTYTSRKKKKTRKATCSEHVHTN